MARNKGEWSEIYSILSLINERCIPLSTATFEPSDSFITVNKIHNNDGTSIDLISGRRVVFGDAVFAVEDVAPDSLVLQVLNAIRAGSKTFDIPVVREFETRHGVRLEKGSSAVKSDVFLDITSSNQILGNQGFGIKSLLGSRPTLLNASRHTNFVFRVTGVSGSRVAFINGLPKLTDRLRALGGVSNLVFVGADSEVMDHNLRCCDSQLPDILAAMLAEFFFNRTNTMLDVISSIDCSKFGLEQGQVEIVMKRFLMDYMLGFFPSKFWDGTRTANGLLAIKNDGSQLAFHVIEADVFKEYLLTHVKFDSPSTTRHKYGSVYSDGGDVFLKLNLQIRFS